MALYRLTDGTTIIRTSDGASIPPDQNNRDFAAYSEWLAAGNSPDPYIPLPPSPEDTRAVAFRAEADRVDLLQRLKTATPAQISTWVNNNITDPGTRVVLKAILKVIALDQRT